VVDTQRGAYFTVVAEVGNEGVTDGLETGVGGAVDGCHAISVGWLAANSAGSGRPTARPPRPRPPRSHTETAPRWHRAWAPHTDTPLAVSSTLPPIPGITPTRCRSRATRHGIDRVIHHCVPPAAAPRGSGSPHSIHHLRGLLRASFAAADLIAGAPPGLTTHSTAGLDVSRARGV
jgi:hypothetical protein